MNICFMTVRLPSKLMLKMKTRSISYLLTLLIAFVLTSCNNDIFIDAEPLPDTTEITLEGDGGSWSTTIPRDGLKKITMYNLYRDTKGYLTYYDHKDNKVNPDCPVSELGAIIFENPAQHYIISFYGKKLSINSYYNCYPKDYIVLLLEYDYGGTKKIHITFTEGKQLDFFCVPEGEMTVEDNFEEISHRTAFTNNSSLTQKFEIYPYINCNCSYEVIPEYSWSKKMLIDNMAIPTYTGKEWLLVDHKTIYLGDRFSFSPSRYIYDKITVDVPPYTKATVNYTLHYSRAYETGKFIITNVVAERQFEMSYKTTSIYATKYDYTVEYE